MKHINGITFAPFARKGALSTEEARLSLRAMKQRTGANFIILVPEGIQETPQSEKIDFAGGGAASDEELAGFISYAHSLGLDTCLKPTVNCKNGTWRAHINFFDEDVPCEPKWGNWFESYTDFQLHYARLAKKCGCEMFIAGCEMVQSERREREWRKLILDIRTAYDGPVSYNTDKYQEHNVKWWDAVDVISSSGYYPVDDWENQLDRIEKVVQKFNKPFFFAECGCMSTKGSKYTPNDWSIDGGLDLSGQTEWYRAMFTACRKRDWVGGFAIWSWPDTLPPLGDASLEKHYSIYAKPCEAEVKGFYEKYC